MREIYLKPFELAVKEGGTTAVMSSYNFIGNEWAAGCKALCTDLLRGEWGFEGFVLTDYFRGYGYQVADMAIRAGNDCMLATYDTGSNSVSDLESATSIIAMRRASKNILFTVVNSRAYDAENLNTGLMSWQIALIVIDVLIGIVIIATEVMIFKGYAQRKKKIAKNT